QMEEGLDTGAYCISRSVPAGVKNASELTDDLAHMGADALLEALSLIEQDKVRWKFQDPEKATYANKIGKGELNLDPSISAADAVRRVRASGPSHSSRAIISGRPVTVLQARIDDECEAFGVNGFPDDALPLKAGEALFTGKRLFLGFEDGPMEVISLKPDGKREIDAKAFAAGSPALKTGSSWSGPDVS
ncbi:MAG: methionyl-tRNA formyltransferase, partial [Eggerthellaceae bacterium]|nr:methionyl-tRNA formyltransferase [Eggerthellaceae bacterium]